MKKYSIFILTIIISNALLGQKSEHYVSKYCDCYIGPEPGKSYHEQYMGLFIPTYSNIDSVEMALRITHKTFRDSIGNLDRYARYYSGFINTKGHKSIHIWADWEPDKDGMRKSDGEWEINYDLITKRFYGFKEIGG